MKLTKLTLFLIPFLLLLIVQCDTRRTVESPAERYFVKYLGNEGAQTGVDFEVNSDGTFVMLGTSKRDPASHTELYVVKADAQGQVLWEKFFSGPLDLEARDIELASDGRIVILGNSYQSGSIAAGGSRDVLIKTLTPDGAEINSALFGYKKAVTATDSDEDATTVTQTNDGFIVAGSTDNIKLNIDSTGVVYERLALIARLNNDLTKYPAPWADPPAVGQATQSVTTKIFQVANGSFYGFGYAKWNGAPSTDFNFWYFSLGANGGEPNDDVGIFGYPGADEKWKSVAYIPTALGGGFILGGISTRGTSNDSVSYTRLRSQLDFQPTDPSFGPKALLFNIGKPKIEIVSVCVSQTSGYFILANEASIGNDNFFLMKIDAVGNPVWTSPTIYGGQGDDFIGSVRELPDGRIVVFGTMSIGQQGGETKMVLIKVNQDGQFAD